MKYPYTPGQGFQFNASIYISKTPGCLYLEIETNLFIMVPGPPQSTNRQELGNMAPRPFPFPRGYHSPPLSVSLSQVNTFCALTPWSHWRGHILPPLPPVRMLKRPLAVPVVVFAELWSLRTPVSRAFLPPTTGIIPGQNNMSSVLRLIGFQGLPLFSGDLGLLLSLALGLYLPNQCRCPQPPLKTISMAKRKYSMYENPKNMRTQTTLDAVLAYSALISLIWRANNYVVCFRGCWTVCSLRNQFRHTNIFKEHCTRSSVTKN